MERSRESRRSSMANGFPRRRNRTIALRDSSEEGAVVEASSKRGRNRDRDRDSSYRSKRRRGSHSHSTEEEEESFGNEQDNDVLQDAGVSRMRYLNTTLSASDRNHRRSSTPARPPPPPPLKVTDEMIGVAVPRKARSASVKRTNETCVSASGGGEEQNFREQSSSSGRHSVEPASPSSSSASAKKKMKAIGGVANTSKSSSSDIEIEIAELLYGLKTSKNHESPSCPSKDVENNKVEDYNTSAPVPNDSTAELVRIQSEQPANVDCHHGNANESSEPPKDPKENIEGEKFNSGAGYGGITEEKSCTKLDVDKQDSASTRVISAVSEANNQRVGKFEIDLMAPPPMMLASEGDDLSRPDFTSETKALVANVETKGSSTVLVERPVKKEKSQEEIEEAKMAPLEEKRDVLKHDVEKPNNGDDINNKLEEQDWNKEEPPKSSYHRVEKTAQPSSVPSSAAVSGRSSSLYSIGSKTMTGRYTLPLQTVVKADKTTGPLTTPQHVNFVLSQPQPKRCATHHYIARNIFLHQQFTKMNSHLPAAISSSSLHGTKPNNVNCVPSAESMVIAKQSSKHLPGVNQNVAQEKGCAATSKSSNNANPVDSTQRMQLVLQQGPPPQSTGNLVHGPAFLFPPGQHQASVAAATSQAGGVNSTSSSSSYSNCHSAAAGSLCTSSTFPAVAATMSFSYPKFSTNDAPYMTIVQNNGYSFPFSTSLGPSAAIRGASPAPATHILNAPFYSSQMFHPLQHSQQHPHSQMLVQPSHLNASTSSSSSHKQSQGAQVNGSNIFTSPPMKPQQSQKQQTSLSRPRKHETEIGRDNAPSVANKTSYPQNNVHGQNLTIPVQPVNFSFRPSATSDIAGGNSGKFGDKQKQQQALKGAVEIIPSQAFAISFAAFNGTSVPSNLNFSSMAQNPVIFRSLPDVAWQGYQAASASPTTQQKTYSITEGKSGGNSSNQDDEKKATHGKSSTNGPTTLVFDNSSKNLNFMSSPANGNWPSLSIASTAITSVPLSINALSSQQPSQLLQVQKQYAMQQQQTSMATQYKASSTNTTTAKFGNNAPVFSQTVTQCKTSNQASHSKSSRKTTDSHVHQTSVVTSNTPTIKSFSQEQGRVSQGHMQISFAGNYITSLPPQGQQPLDNNQPLCTTVAGSPRNGGNLKPNSDGKKASSSVNTSQMQQTENSSVGNGQKSSPVCGRNVPSILSSCPSHLSELKY